MENYHPDLLYSTCTRIMDSMLKSTISNDDKGKTASKLLELSLVFDPSIKISDTGKKLKTSYPIRRTGKEEQNRKKQYVGDFNYKHCEAYKRIQAMAPHINDSMVKGFVSLVLELEENERNKLIEKIRAEHLSIPEPPLIPKPPRDASRSKPALYKFINDNYSLFNKHISVSKILTGEFE